MASAFAGHIGVALDRAALRVQVANLLTAVETNREIGAAIGVLMARRGIGYDEAFELLRDASQQANRKLRLVASEVLYTGTLPESIPLQRISVLAGRGSRTARAIDSQVVELGEDDERVATT